MILELHKKWIKFFLKKYNFSQQPPQSHSYHHLTVPGRHDPKKEATQLSPVKKRVKEGTPPNENQRTHRDTHHRAPHGQSASPNYWHHQQSGSQVLQP